MRIGQKTSTALLVLAGVAGILLQSIAGLYGWENIDLKGYSLMGAAALCFAIPLIISIIAKVKASESGERRHALSILTELTYKLLNPSEECDLRVTLLKVNTGHNPPQLEQMVRYTSTSRVVGESTMTVYQGVAGRCYRSSPPSTKLEPHVKDFVQQMVDLGFTEHEAGQFKSDRKTYLCSPVTDSDGTIVAVLSVDAKVPNLFTEEHIQIAERTTPFFARLLAGPEKVGENHG